MPIDDLKFKRRDRFAGGKTQRQVVPLPVVLRDELGLEGRCSLFMSAGGVVAGGDPHRVGLTFRIDPCSTRNE